MRRLAAFLVAVLGTAVAVVAVVPGPAGGDPLPSCSTTTGTIVAVDFGHWGGPIVRGCGAHSASGYQLLTDAGFSHVGDQSDGGGFVCRIGNAAFHGGTQYPTPAQDPCVLTPPASAYWSYWFAMPGATTWTYNSHGAYADQPKIGEVELWQFGGTDVAGTSGRPTINPAALRATNSAPASAPVSTSTPRTATSRGMTSAAHRPPASRPTTAADRPTNTPAPAHRRASTSSHAVTRSSASTSASTPTTEAVVGSGTSADPTPVGIVNAQPAAASRTSSSGSPWPVLVVVLLVAGLGGGAAAAAWRRRRPSAE